METAMYPKFYKAGHVHQQSNVTHCEFKEDSSLCRDSLCGPVPIVLALDDSIIVLASHPMRALPAGVKRLTPEDSFGNYLIEVPVSYVEEWLTAHEARAVLEAFEEAGLR